jgi:peptidoglycan/LPS O-acetylase OafA/YrhL
MRSVSQGAHIPALDGLRGLAVLMVLTLHYGGGGASSPFLPVRFVGKLFHLGWSGVSLFFVLSGFLISGILWDSFSSNHWWRNFYLRRSLRIFPLYYFALLLALLAPTAMTHPIAAPFELSWSYPLYLQNIPGLHLRSVESALYVGHFWSLAVEEQFYLIWPFLLWLAAPSIPRAMMLCAVTWLLSFGFRIVMMGLAADFEWASWFLLARAGELSTGAFLALAIRRADFRKVVSELSKPILAATAVMLIALFIWSGDVNMEKSSTIAVGYAVFGIFFAALLACCLEKGLWSHVFEWPLLRWIGRISYGVYVYHLLLSAVWLWIAFRIAPNAGKNGRMALVAFVALIGTLIVANLSYRFIESPFLRLKAKFKELPRVS